MAQAQGWPRHVALGAGCLIGSLVISKFGLSHFMGTESAHLSLSASIVPLVGLFGGTVGSLFFFLMKTLFHAPAASLCGILLRCHLPSLAGALFCTRWSKSLLVVPVACMLLFIMHPVGYQAAPYALFWFLPFLTLIFPQSVFCTILGSTFTTHAVGSILWLYGGLIAHPAAWLALIPVVMFERLFITTMAWGGYRIIAGWSGTKNRKQEENVAALLQQ